MKDERTNQLIVLLYDMDRQQQSTDDAGQREIAWYYYRDEIEDVMGLPRGALDSGRENDSERETP